MSVLVFSTHAVMPLRCVLPLAWSIAHLNFFSCLLRPGSAGLITLHRRDCRMPDTDVLDLSTRRPSLLSFRDPHSPSSPIMGYSPLIPARFKLQLEPTKHIMNLVNMSLSIVNLE
ncbi:hypothetical protein QBC37DRAFT_429213 [Rhypophila decipiens]|uniref:Uncharacterized protein n=1 Tax=Rhypophila decipiens TaxID=261697 RepID=A0AAN6Y0G4_9PEZI|nr:hypothetical protein QBC37DRAFT_429213 [Rhypophila decipiens]